MSDKIYKARAYFDDGFNCAQSVLGAYSSDLGLDKTDALRVAGAFGAGMGRMGKVCGAVTGAFMTIGLVSSKSKEGEDDLRDNGYSLVREFTKRFEQIHGSIECKELIGVDLSTDAGLKEAKEKRLIETKCVRYVEDAVKILENILC